MLSSSLMRAGIALAIWAVPMFTMLGVVFLARRWYHEGRRRNPLSRGLLRGPGYSLQEKLDHLRFDLLLSPMYFASLPIVIFAVVLMFHGTVELPPLHWIAIAVVTVAVMFINGLKIVGLTKRVRDYRLGLEAETAVGQELNLLMKDGFSVFHDVPSDKDFNLDHVVVGPQGVFAVETKGRGKPIARDGSETHRVQYDGRKLIFPGWTETRPLEQARANAAWLRKWLTSAIGTPIDVTPVLMLPGWYIDRTSPPGMAVMNGTNCRNFFIKSRDQQLSDQLVRQIAHQLDARCRDVAPRAYKSPKD